MKKTKMLSALLALLATASFTVSCKPAAGGEETTVAPNAETTAAENVVGDHRVVTGGVSDYVIVRPDVAGSYEKTAASDLRDLITDRTGCRLDMTIDWYIKADGAAEHEILVGHTEREESAAVSAEIDAEGGYFYIIRDVGGKIVINATTERKLSEAFDYIAQNFITEAGDLIIPRGVDIKSENVEPTISQYFAKDKTTTLSGELVGTIQPIGSCKNIQGGTSDGHYLYVILNDGGKTNESKSAIVKIDIATMRVVQTARDILVCHGNDIAYIKSTNELVVVHNAPDRNMLSVFDADTLAFKQKVKLPLNIYCLSYDESLDCYWVGVSGGDNFAKLTKEFKLSRAYTSKGHPYVTQGMDCDSEYLYFVRYKTNCVIAYDKSGGFVGEYPITFSGEPENIVRVGDVFYIIGNNKSWNGGNIYRFTPTME